MNWQFCLISLALCSAAACALVCIDGYRSGKRKGRLSAPRRETIRSVYHEHAHTVGNMRGVR